MLLTMTSTAPDARDLGYLLHKHPDRVQHFDLSVGRAHAFYPEASEEKCTAALLLEVDPVGLVRSRRFGGDGFTLGQYVNDRPWAASSLLAVALARVFSTALKGRCDARPDLATADLPLTVRLPAVPVPDGPAMAEQYFAPLGWDVDARPAPLDPAFPDWGDAPYIDLTLRGTIRLSEALRQLYVLLPVMDGAKHYWVHDDEIDKLVRSGAGWLAAHPLRDRIADRYLAHQRVLVADATDRLAALDDAVDESAVADDDEAAAGHDDEPATSYDEDRGDTTGHEPAHTGTPGTTDSLGQQHRSLTAARRSAVVDALRAVRAARVVDLGCGEGSLVRELLTDARFTEIVGADVSARELARAERRLGLDRLSDSVRSRITLIQSSASYVDARLAGFDAIVLAEVIEHLDADRLPSVERNVFGAARPAAVIVTTPNADYNPLYPGLAPGAMRHPDHRFEWTRAEFAAWVDRIGGEFGYTATISPVGASDPDRGAPTQLAVFTRAVAGEVRAAPAREAAL